MLREGRPQRIPCISFRGGFASAGKDQVLVMPGVTSRTGPGVLGSEVRFHSWASRARFNPWDLYPFQFHLIWTIYHGLSHPMR